MSSGDNLLGIPSLDEQRQFLSQLLGLISSATHEENSSRFSTPMLRDLVDFFSQHCQYEEQLMNTVEYSQSQGHQQLHKTILERLKRMVTSIPQSSAVEKDLQNIESLVVEHMNSVDDEFVCLVKKKLIDDTD